MRPPAGPDQRGRAFRNGNWRRERDSNPRWTCAHNGFRDRPVQPLRHLSWGISTTDCTHEDGRLRLLRVIYPICRPDATERLQKEAGMPEYIESKRDRRTHDIGRNTGKSVSLVQSPRTGFGNRESRMSGQAGFTNVSVRKFATAADAALFDRAWSEHGPAPLKKPGEPGTPSFSATEVRHQDDEPTCMYVFEYESPEAVNARLPVWKERLAPRDGFEPPAKRLTVACSTAELPGKSLRRVIHHKFGDATGFFEAHCHAASFPASRSIVASSRLSAVSSPRSSWPRVDADLS